MSLIDISSQPIVRSAERTPAPKLPSGKTLKRALENFGLFLFGFASTSLLIHIAVGFFLASRMSCLFTAGAV